MKTSAALLALCVLAAAPAAAQQPSGLAPQQGAQMGTGGGMEKPSTAAFVEDVAVGTMYEVQASKLAVEQTQRDDLKSFAQMMIKDHSDAEAQFKAALAKSQGAPEPPRTMDSEHVRKLEDLRAAQKGDAFDKAYVNAMIEAHERDLKLFQGYARSGDAPALKSFAEQTAPVIQRHLEHARKLDRK